MTEKLKQPIENKLEHPCFPQPTEKSIQAWRYLDIAKFIWLLENKKLYLARLDKLQDPHEGTTPKLSAKIRDDQMRKWGGDQLAAQLPIFYQRIRKSTYVNCWHTGSAESEAMWRLYCPNDSGVAIQTTYKKLVETVDTDPQCYVGAVKYIDYETQYIPLDNFYYPVMHKRLSFAHEQEVRLVKSLSEYSTENAPEGPEGIEINWMPETSIEKVFVNPYAPEYYFDVVRSILHHYAPNLKSRLYWSQMRATPIY